MEKDTDTGSTIGGIKRPSGIAMFNFLHAGSVDGWVPNCALVFIF